MSSFAEEDHLLPVANSLAKSKSQLKKSCCIKSKAVCLILLWNFAVLLVYSFLSVNNELEYPGYYHTSISIIGAVGIIAVFAPMVVVIMMA